MSNKKNLILAVTVALVMVSGLSACGGSGSDKQGAAPAADQGTQDESLSLEAQIGPITSVELGDIDADLVAKGEAKFSVVCTACHKMDTRVVGPPLGQVLSSRSPVYVMNMIMNPDGMLAEHPDAKAMLAEYAVPMANLGISQEDARAILEYLRANQTTE